MKNVLLFCYNIGNGDVLRKKRKQDVTERLDFMKDEKKNCELRNFFAPGNNHICVVIPPRQSVTS